MDFGPEFETALQEAASSLDPQRSRGRMMTTPQHDLSGPVPDFVRSLRNRIRERISNPPEKPDKS
jgi:hypothetical protein